MIDWDLREIFVTVVPYYSSRGYKLFKIKIPDALHTYPQPIRKFLAQLLLTSPPTPLVVILQEFLNSSSSPFQSIQNHPQPYCSCIPFPSSLGSTPSIPLTP